MKSKGFNAISQLHQVEILAKIVLAADLPHFRKLNQLHAQVVFVE